MSAKPKNQPAAEEVEETSAEPVAEPTVETAAAEPEVEQHPSFEVGQLVRHASGKCFKVRGVHPHGIALEGVANLIDPAVLTPVEKA